MDLATRGAFVVLGLLVAGVLWWYVADECRQRRRARAEVWARQQVSPDEPPDEAQPSQRHWAYDTVPLDLPATEQLGEPSELVRPFIRAQGYTDVFPPGERPPPP
ncbi:hypothetical protein FKR81_38255 [Lentzea tibetensis]|uniref:Uncharacterized protein n=1 Tax=Lentzea tibetensis TaxID=2591470 RepID=A0A563EIR5_9PSEU|nr:hypothetical protein [Lentzea tibetensis]TWP45818.1 hypothetical protein FKR81_38255 [Lentzea tibetensis]